MTRFRSKIWIVAIAVGLLLAMNSAALAQLKQYVNRPDPAFAWKYLATQSSPQGKIYELHMVSQVWQGIRWEHQLQVYEPKDLRFPHDLLLFITGGHADKGSVQIGFALADHAGMRVAVLYQIPDQPLFGGKKEDALIAYTFVQYLHTGDASWPLLFPMVKSVIKAMDALQAFAPKGWGEPVNKFIVAGVSKRGWTTWLAASTGDPRIVAIAPMAIDTLNIPAQMKHQLAVYGHYSSEIDDYVNAGLLKPKVVSSPAGRRLWRMVDPYTYRQTLTLPKLIARGTNDPYWTQDALNYYWNGLQGGKWILYVPNATHNMGEDRERVFNTTGAFARHVASSTPMPHLSWKYTHGAKVIRLTIRADQPPRAARLWYAHSASLDFRKSHWRSVPMHKMGASFVGEYPQPTTNNLAVFGEVDYTFEGQPYTLSTQVRIATGKLPVTSGDGRAVSPSGAGKVAQ
ncbi:MAG: PhoPQ-activated pathogenicity-related family protein [Candidatus Acidiferrales bacterium]